MPYERDIDQFERGERYFAQPNKVSTDISTEISPAEATRKVGESVIKTIRAGHMSGMQMIYGEATREPFRPVSPKIRFLNKR